MSKGVEKKGLVPKLRFPEFRNASGWSTARLGDLVRTIPPPKKLQTQEYRLSGSFPIIDQSQSVIAGWTDDEAAVLRTSSTLIVFGDHTCALKRLTIPFAQGADGIKIIEALAEIDVSFLFQSLTHKPLQMEEYKRHFGILCDRVVAMPDTSLPKQRKAAEAEQRRLRSVWSRWMS